MLQTAVFGASGYAGGEVVKIIDGHPEMSVGFLGAHSRAGVSLGSVQPHLGGGDRVLADNDPAQLPDDVEVAFLALPHGKSTETALSLRDRGIKVVDLGSDFRLDSNDRYLRGYGSDHPHPEQLADWAYGLPELFEVADEDQVAAPGCYPTAVLLAIAPLAAAGLVDQTSIVADCLSGVSGAGRSARDDLTFGAIAEGVRGYGLTNHRHRPEIEMGLELAGVPEPRVVFTPHLVPMLRGELATVTVPTDTDVETARSVLKEAYDASPFVSVIDTPPQTRWVVGSNQAMVAVWVDEWTGRLISQCGIDNLVKGAAGQAVQCANLMFGLPESTGLSTAGWMP
ncbi:MAG: N-acetyl-gamma-glutamyl-phosphate reductase [Acidimicrobiia bacterium]|nr:N-acetyl-gamma-glutamyl-phosphate reductase [Acidimicrobiia bacterium]